MFMCDDGWTSSTQSLPTPPCQPNDLLLPSSRLDSAGSPTLLVRIDIDMYSGCLLVSWNVDPLTAVCVVTLLLCGVLLVGEKVQVRAIWTQLHCGHRLHVKYLWCTFICLILLNKFLVPVSVTARSKAWVCGRLRVGIVGSNPVGGMGVCYECRVLSGRGLWVGLITRSEEFSRVRSVWVWSWNLDNEEPSGGLLRRCKKNFSSLIRVVN